ncbi:HAD family hydrolase [Vallitaleaceae bacterium 9-2]
MKYTYILFDLDGTLTDPREGITKSVAYALNKMGQKSVNLDELTKFIGPPLKDSFMDYYNFTEDEANKAIELYREYFKDIGIFENHVYQGIPELLKALIEQEKILIVATSKPTVFAERIIRHFDLEKYFKVIIGSNLDGTRTNKAEVIETALLEAGIEQKDDVVMIGDRKHDVIGANVVGIDSIGVEYGYGSYEELTKAGATYIVKSTLELGSLLENIE